jgi:hypothetical protein
MNTSRAMNTFRPPDIKVFQKIGRGYLHEAYFAETNGRSTFFESVVKLGEDESWGIKPRGLLEEDLVDVYGYVTMADHMLKKLESMDRAEREKQLALDTDAESGITYEEVSKQQAELAAMIRVWEEQKPALVYAALDRQLKRRLDSWEEALDRAKRINFVAEGPFESMDEYMTYRDLLEYAAMGITELQAEDSKRLRPLPYLSTFISRTRALDERFEEVLNGRYEPAPWTDAQRFWWHYPPGESV